MQSLAHVHGARDQIHDDHATNRCHERILVSSGISVSARGDAPHADDAAWRKASARIGSTLRGKWRIDALLGVGGMAAVYAATHRNGSRVAVKVLHPELSGNATVRERFLWEGYVTNAVGHEGVVKVIDDEDDDGSLFLVTELLDGETLEDRRSRRGGRLPQEEVLALAHQLLAVLEAAHANGIVHSDVKPDNVFLTRAGQVKLLDFGIARLHRPSGPTGPALEVASAGTPAYMPPEQAVGLSEQLDERSDLWACGATMFCLLSGRTVHEGKSVEEQFVRAMTEPAPAASAVVADLHPAVGHMVDRALAFDRDRRWKSAGEMRAAVSDAYVRLTGRPMPGSVPTDDVVVIGTSSFVVPDAGRPARAGSRPPTERTAMDSDPFLALRRWRARRRALVVACGATLLGMAAAATTWMVSADELPEPLRAAAVVTSPVVCPMPSGPSAVAPTATLADLAPPAAPVARRTSPAAGGPARATNRGQGPPVTPADCEPPYVVDEATGKKTWKLECL